MNSSIVQKKSVLYKQYQSAITYHKNIAKDFSSVLENNRACSKTIKVKDKIIYFKETGKALLIKRRRSHSNANHFRTLRENDRTILNEIVISLSLSSVLENDQASSTMIECPLKQWSCTETRLLTFTHSFYITCFFITYL